jgi:hypothetical protein
MTTTAAIPAGTKVTCSNCGHHVCSTAVDLWPGTSAHKSANLTGWQIPVPDDLTGDMPPCPECGAPWHLREVQGYVQVQARPLVLAPFFREFLHTEAGWFPPRLEG